MKTSRINFVLRILLGAFLILYALNQFLHFLPTGYGQMPDFTRDYLDAVAAFLPALYIFEILIGLFLLLNVWTPMIAIVLTPLSISFLIFNFANGDWNLISAGFVAILNLGLLLVYWPKYKPLFRS